MIECKSELILPEQMMTHFKKNLELKEICHNILYQRIIDKAVKERNITVTPEEIQAEADKVRYENSLVKASDTIAWLTDQLITPNDWEAGIRDRLLAKKLSESLFAKEVEKYFQANKIDFDQVVLYQIVIPYRQVVQEVFYQIEESEISFYEAAHLYDVDSGRRYNCGYEGKIYRWNLKPDIATVVFSAKVGQVIAPLQIDQTNYMLMMVEEFIPAELTSEIYQDMLNRMFREWLAAELNYSKSI